MKVEWTDAALRHLFAIYEYLAQTSPKFATRMVDRITKRSKQILKFPLSGRIVREYHSPKIREVIEGSYRIIYLIKPDQIEIIAVVHAARKHPWDEDDD